MSNVLTIDDHSREVAGLHYVYPVISRRSGGLSVGINFNTNNACNWRCIYCQVPNLKLGAAPELDFQRLADELREFLNDVLYGDFYQRFGVAEADRVVKDIAISGNGEPTSVKAFDRAVTLVGDLAEEFGVLPRSNFVLITNGSLIHRPNVQRGLERLHAYRGEVWFKWDSATAEGRRFINNAGLSLEKSKSNLLLASRLCVTKLQICLFNYNQHNPLQREQEALLDMLASLKQQECELADVMLYTLARKPLQPEAECLERLSADCLEKWASTIRQLGFNVQVYG